MTNIPQFKNEVHIAGVLVKDPDLRYTTSGKAVCKLTVATKYKEFTEYHRVTCWEQLGEKVAVLSKGAFVQVVGRLQTRSWEDKANGEKKYMTEVVSFQVVIPGKEPATPTGTEVTSGEPF